MGIKTVLCKACGMLFQTRDFPCLSGDHGAKYCGRRCAGLGGGDSKIMPSDEPELIRLAAEGMTTKELASRFGCRDGVIIKRLRHLGMSRGKARRGSVNGMFGRTHTPEAIAKIRSANARQFATTAARTAHAHRTIRAIEMGKFGNTSKLETVVGEALVRLGVRALPQHGIRSQETGRYIACVDFFLPDLNAALEVNGTFWHADPRVYDGSNLKPAQVKTLERYAVKEAELRKMGIPIVEVWEADIRRDTDAAVRAALGL
jgi:G:T-mismatch repair DNA endonuclease (very short patch repair protein)